MVLVLAYLVSALVLVNGDYDIEYPFHEDEEASPVLTTQVAYTKYEVPETINDGPPSSLRTLSGNELADLKAALKEVLPNFHDDVTLSAKEDLSFSVVFDELKTSTTDDKYDEREDLKVYLKALSKVGHQTSPVIPEYHTTHLVHWEPELSEDSNEDAVVKISSTERGSQEIMQTEKSVEYEISRENKLDPVWKEKVDEKVVVNKEADMITPETLNVTTIGVVDDELFKADDKLNIDRAGNLNAYYDEVEKNISKFIEEDTSTLSMEDIGIKPMLIDRNDLNADNDMIYKDIVYKDNKINEEVDNFAKAQYKISDNESKSGESKTEFAIDTKTTESSSVERNYDEKIPHSATQVGYINLDDITASADSSQRENSPEIADSSNVDDDVYAEYYDDTETSTETTEYNKFGLRMSNEPSPEEFDKKLREYGIGIALDSDGDSDKGEYVPDILRTPDTTKYSNKNKHRPKTAPPAHYDSRNRPTTDKRHTSTKGETSKKASTTVTRHTSTKGETASKSETSGKGRIKGKGQKTPKGHEGRTPPKGRTIRRGRTTSTSKKPKIRKSTEPRIDVPILMDYIKNLTIDYSIELTDMLNKSLRKYSLPTCGQPTTTTEEPTTTPTTTTTEKFSNVTGTIMGKCFVCGLEVRGIPLSAPCSDAFAGDVIPLLPLNPTSRAHIASYRKYCRFMDIPHYHLNTTEPKNLWGRWTGGCSVRWIDLSGIYTQRSCRNRHNAIRGRHFVSKRMSMLEMALQHVDNGCIISPMASLVPLSRGVSLFARFHACVCTGNWCNHTSKIRSLSQFLVATIFVKIVLCFIL